MHLFRTGRSISELEIHPNRSDASEALSHSEESAGFRAEMHLATEQLLSFLGGMVLIDQVMTHVDKV